MKCEGCPIAEAFDELCAFWNKPDAADCHLTTRDFPIINAMIAGALSCDTCKQADKCDITGFVNPLWCNYWLGGGRR